MQQLKHDRRYSGDIAREPIGSHTIRKLQFSRLSVQSEHSAGHAHSRVSMERLFFVTEGKKLLQIYNLCTVAVDDDLRLILRFLPLIEKRLFLFFAVRQS